MELVSEWTNEQVSLHDNHEDRPYLSNIEEDPENKWVEALFNLNAKVGKNQRAILVFNPACEKGFVDFVESGLNTNLGATAEWRRPKLQPACSFEETFDLSMQLLLLIGDTSQRRTELDTSGNIHAFTGFETSLANGASNPASSGFLTYLGDDLLLLSCYLRLLGSLCSMLECFNRIIARSDKGSLDHAIRYIHSFLPRIQMGAVSLCANPRFDIAMVLNSAESTLVELNECIVKRLLTNTLERPPADMPALFMDCFLEQSDRSSFSDQGDSSEMRPSWQMTIRDIQSTALEKISMLKRAILIENSELK
ncbi:uncharacterized protein N7498_007151 [Penicillium cinerascens]|uniref:Uncharacterized protein n=1 Tax=Penicillium cinerascens TaxID=70096 RepID=A0A9W9JKK7_9EURO|nr:uncharacterized protein N7498_007151 [Penicillium cinerascens]KAJ5198034.1 hypothetical protein N7498_007151 [Penicillium cinerascens]